jgi:undecaprenyl-diphosphatase
MENIVIFGASYLYLVILLIAVAAFILSGAATRWKLLKLALVVLPVAFVVATGLGFVITSPRPFVVEQVAPLIPASTDNGFPSDHTLLAASVAAVVFAYHRKVGVALLVLAACVGLARVLARVHHPIDVLGSLAIALSITYLAYNFVVDRIPPISPNADTQRSVRP